MNFPESIAYLERLGHETLTMKFGLRNTETMLSALSQPQKSFVKIQLAGTNGKGSVAAFLDAVLRAAGLSIGLYTSPHLISVTERIRINNSNITENRFAEIITEINETAAELITQKKLDCLPTFFEQITVAALLAFRQAKIAAAILETGLGGKLDATTAAQAEIVGITPISLDHQEYLGNTLAEIAAEKAAVISPTSRVVISNQNPAALNAITARLAAVKNPFAPIPACSYQIKNASADGRITADFTSLRDVYPNVTLNLRGRHQLENAATAICLAEILREFDFAVSREAVINGLQTAVHPGRLETRGGILFDGAHNIAGAAALKRFLNEFYADKPLTIIFAAMRDKDLRDIAAELFPLADNLILTRADNLRSAAPKDLQQYAPPDVKNVYQTATAAEALTEARKLQTANGQIVVTGSLYLIGEAQRVLAEE